MQGDSMNRLALRPTDMLIGRHGLIGMSMETSCLYKNRQLR
jgi:hypothetical protein